MQAGARVARPLTVQLRLEVKVTYLEFVNAIREQFGKESVVCCQPHGLGFQVTFSGKGHMANMITKGILVAGTRIFPEVLEEAAVWVTVRNVPYEVSHTAVKAELSGYGQVFSCEYEIPRETAPVTNGNRRVKMRMRRPVPNFLKLGAYSMMVTYPGVVKLCRRCNLEGHVASACVSSFCGGCHQWGHNSADCPEAERVPVPVVDSPDIEADFPSLPSTSQPEQPIEVDPEPEEAVQQEPVPEATQGPANQEASRDSSQESSCLTAAQRTPKPQRSSSRQRMSRQRKSITESASQASSQEREEASVLQDKSFAKACSEKSVFVIPVPSRSPSLEGKFVKLGDGAVKRQKLVQHKDTEGKEITRDCEMESEEDSYLSF